jgi:hypothetical protein
MRRWRAADGRVVAELGDGCFALIAGAEIARVLAPHDDSVDDDLYLFSYDVDGGALWQRTEVRTYGEDDRRRSDRVEIGGLAALGAREAPTPRDVVLAMDARERAAQAREDDVAARIEEAARAFAVPPALAAARRRLVERVVRWDDGVARAMLALVEELCRAPLPDGAIEALGAACGHATFAPRREDPPDGIAHGALAGRFGDAQRALLDAADVQEQADANLNAAAYRRAERWLRIAAKLAPWT